MLILLLTNTAVSYNIRTYQTTILCKHINRRVGHSTKNIAIKAY